LLYKSLTTYIFVDLATGTCCFLVLVGLAGIISRGHFLSKAIGLAGIYSYGLYLVHQPYVIWLGLRIRQQPIWCFLFIALATIFVLTLWGMLLERATNSFVSFLVRDKPKPAFSSS